MDYTLWAWAAWFLFSVIFYIWGVIEMDNDDDDVTEYLLLIFVCMAWPAMFISSFACYMKRQSRKWLKR